MRKIALFNPNQYSTHSLNVFSRLTRRGKRVLLIDLRKSRLKASKNGFDIVSCLETGSFSKFIVPVEKGFDMIQGSSRLNSSEFRFFNSLFKFDVFEQALAELDYDYVVFEMSPYLDILTLNVLFVVNEVMIFHKLGESLAFDMSHFLCDFNELYSHKILISHVVPVYSGVLDRNKYTELVSLFTSFLVTFPLPLEKSNKDYGVALREINDALEDSEEIFIPTNRFDYALEKQKEFEALLYKIKEM